MNRTPLLVVTALALAGCSSKGPAVAPLPPPAKTPTPTPAVSTMPRTDRELIRALTVLATRKTPSSSDLDRITRDIASGTTTLSAYIDTLVASEDFAKQVAPLMVLRQYLSLDADGAPLINPLQKTDGPNPIYYLQKPCTAAQAVKVKPWWDLDHEVQICSDSYMPDTWERKHELGVADCLSQDGYGHPACGCGPNLMRCVRSLDEWQQYSYSMRHELRDTVAYIAGNDLPAEQIFTSTSTFRDRSAEHIRLLETIEQRRTRDPEALLRKLSEWPAEGKWAPREELVPGQHAGILTQSMLIQNQGDRRQRMAVLYDVMWCLGQDAVGSTPEALMSIKSANLQIDNAGWKELAARTPCTNCHARLDYGMRFFWGYSSGYLKAFYDPKVAIPESGPLFVDNIDDKRGETKLDPQSFAQLAVAQPEFKSCMAHDVAAYVFGNRLTPEILEQVQGAVDPKTTKLRSLMRAALQALVADWAQQGAAAGKSSAVAAADRAATIAVHGEMATQLQDKCTDCHDADGADLHKPDLTLSQLTRPVVVDAMAAVAFGRMPKAHPLPASQRQAFLDAFIGATWPAAEAQTAREYFSGRMQALPAYRPEVMFDAIRAATGGTIGKWRLLEPFIRSELSQVTPNVGAVAGAATIQACRSAKPNASRAEIDRCIEDTIKLDVLAIDPR